MPIISVKTIELDACKTNVRFSRMRGHAAFLREKFDVQEALARWAVGANDLEIDGMRRDLRVQQLRTTALQAG